MSAFGLPTLGENVYMKVVAGPASITSALAPTSGSFIDVSLYEWFAFAIILGDNGGNVDMHIEQATAANGTPKDITGAAITQLVNADDNTWAMIQVRTDRLDGANGYKYVTANYTIGTSLVGAILFFGWRGDTVPVSQPAACKELVVLA